MPELSWRSAGLFVFYCIAHKVSIGSSRGRKEKEWTHGGMGLDRIRGLFGVF